MTFRKERVASFTLVGTLSIKTRICRDIDSSRFLLLFQPSDPAHLLRIPSTHGRRKKNPRTRKCGFNCHVQEKACRQEREQKKSEVR